MIITRTPLRISLGGGGTDLPQYYRASSGGFLVAAAISKYVFIAVNQNFDDSILLKYSDIERVWQPDEIRHPLFRESLDVTGVSRRVEVSAMADIPAGTGLGSSGTFTVGLLRALHAYNHEAVTNLQLAEEACAVELERLREPIGKQDQYIAAVGGIRAFAFNPDDSVEMVPIKMSPTTRFQLEDNLLLFYTGIRRSASEVLAIESTRGVSLTDNLDAVKQMGKEAHAALESDDPQHFGTMLTKQWDLKLERAPTELHRRIDQWIRTGLDTGAAGAKLVGAGDGGFLLFYAEDKADLRAAMSELGLDEVRFRIDYEGSTTIVAQ